MTSFLGGSSGGRGAARNGSRRRTESNGTAAILRYPCEKIKPRPTHEIPKQLPGNPVSLRSQRVFVFSPGGRTGSVVSRAE